MFRSTGILRYSPNLWLVVDVDQGMADFYRWLITRYIPINRQKYPAHISVVRREKPTNIEVWNKYEGHEIEFEYSPEVTHDETYYWLDVKCDRLKEIRMELGLPACTTWRNQFHITIGNIKHLKDVSPDE